MPGPSLPFLLITAITLTSLYLLLPTSLPSTIFSSSNTDTYTNGNVEPEGQFFYQVMPPTIAISLSAPAEIKEGEPLVVKVTATHNEEVGVRVLNWNSPLRNEGAKYKGAFEVTDVATGASAAHAVMQVKFMVPESIPAGTDNEKSKLYLDSFVEVPAGSSGASFDVDLLNGPEKMKPFKLEKGHTYKITTAGRFHDYYRGDLDRSSDKTVPLGGDYTHSATWECKEGVEVKVI